MFWQVLSTFLAIAASVTASLSAKVAFTTPAVDVTIGGTKWGVTTTWTPVP